MSEPRVIDGWSIERDVDGWFAQKGGSFISYNSLSGGVLNIAVNAADWPPPDAVIDALRALEQPDAVAELESGGDDAS